MLEIAHFLLFFSIAIILIVIYIAAQLYKEYRFNYLRSNLFMLIGFSIITLSNTIETYLKIVIPDYYSSNIYTIFSDLALLILPVIIIFATYHAVSLILGLVEKRLFSFVKRITFLIVLIFILSQIIFFINPESFNNIQYFSSISAHIILFISISSSLFYLLFSIRKIKNKGRKKALNLFVSSFLIFILLLFLIAFSSGFEIISLNAQTILISILVFIFNLFLAFFIKRFFSKYHKDYIISNEDHFNELINKFQITNREKEIIALICKGKTNKEIAEELFIAPLTVRDHVSNIFRKVDVNRRLQLANLFRS
jgi:DNA-binding CsgD family transcriptional regulator